jgi:hypothetical protein
VNDTASFRACMAMAQTLVLSTSLLPLDDDTLGRQRGSYLASLAAPWNRYAPALVQSLQAQGYFQPWDTTAGGPGHKPVRAGIIAADTPQARSAVRWLSGSLARGGHAATSYFYTSSQDQQAAVLRFSSSGVTHVFALDNIMFLFMQNAESQRYRPRYAINSLNAPSLLLAGTAPKAQLVGALGLGWMPKVDVDAMHEPAGRLIPGASTCDAVMDKRGPRYAADKRFAIQYFYAFCDMFRFLVAAATEAGLAPEGLRSAVTQMGKVPSAATFRNGLGKGRFSVPAGAVDLRWDAPCQCFRYSGAPRVF